MARVEDSDEEKIIVDFSKKNNAGSNKAERKTNTADSKVSPKPAETGAGISTNATAAAPQVIQYVSKKEKCKYWEKCYQTNKAHKDEFYHPGDDISATDDGRQLSFKFSFVNI